jgi:hypothetical protein
MSTRHNRIQIAIVLWIVVGAVTGHAIAQTPAANSTPSGPTATPSSAPADDTQEADAPADGAAAPTGMVFDPTTGRYMPVGDQLPWRNSFFIFDNSVNHTTFDKSTLSDTSYWIQTYGLRPRWNFTDTLSLRVRQDIYGELVASSTSSEHQPVVLDTQFDLVDAAIVEIGGVLIGVGGRVLLPMSLASRNANRVLGTGGQASATKVFADVLGGLVTQLSTSYQHWWATTATPTGYAPSSLCIADNSMFSCNNFATNTSVRDQFTAGAAGQLQFTPEFSASATFSWIWTRGGALAPINTDPLGPGIDGSTLPDGSKTHWRNLTSSSLSVSYQVNTWLQASFGVSTFTSQISPNGTVRNPLWNPDTQYSLTAVITADQLYTAIIADASTEAAINKRRALARR